MIFSDLYRSPRSPFSKLRASHPHSAALPPDIDADLVSKDKARQKEAVRKFLTERIRNDWDFVWPPPPNDPSTEPTHAPLPTTNVAAVDPHTEPVVPGGLKCVPGAILVDDDDAPRDPGEEADSESDAESVYSTVSEDASRFRPRAEWTSDDDEARVETASPFRFDNPDAVGAAVNTSVLERRTRRRRAVREEVSWNPGLACFEARRNAWTGARTARVKPKPPTPISPASPRRLSFWRSHHRSDSAVSTITPGSPPPASSPLSPTATNTTQQTDISADSPRAPSHESTPKSPTDPPTAVHRTPSHASSSSPSILAVETLIPIPPPLLPPQNPMRASVTPSIYPSLYDKIVVHSLQPSCPVNLADMIRACVVGWKRDGEWPPRSAIAPPPPPAAELRRRQQQAHARKASTATNASGSRRLSLGFLAGGGGVGRARTRAQGAR
ncbi:hypothetical protein B0T18DRAFT_417612 [Schizothecium vesticola]|uniref:Gag1-like clamp domain-containing protein n=1 Tax=Schizothecium vesticola TaxID=314040 RepID=A0AA40EJ49_9PEZI|nr:hypothetical protein B0T18DRAFT_417612 [Schizothecium vesticola]